MIMPVNDGPVAVADALAATEDTAVTYTAAQLLGNDTDVDNQAGDLAIASVTSGTGGTAVLNASGTVTFTPDADFNGAADFTYTVTDGDLESASATATVIVAAVNDGPAILGGTSAGAILVNDTGALDSAVTWGQGQTHYANQTFYAGDVITFDITGVVQSGVTFQLYDSNDQALDASFRVAPGEHQVYSYTVTEELSGIRYRADAAGVGGNPGWVIDASVVSGGLDVDEDASGSFTGLVISDVDAGSDPIAVTLEVGNGDLAFTGGTSGLTFTDSDGSDGTLAFTGSQADINAALGSLDYTGEQDFA
ncbi:cadherin-like domain-containing protein [Hoeflea alexandrii]|nr:cadherin-like domain-containing protein [Hoeflea alexandrii]MCY0154080.1 cadherin-like domain-containing protein [Hoeflea alexandrii]